MQRARRVVPAAFVDPTPVSHGELQAEFSADQSFIEEPAASLVEMGYTPVAARRALAMFNDDFDAALDFLADDAQASGGML